MRVIIHMGDPFSADGPNAKRMRTFYEALIRNGNEALILSPENYDVDFPGVIGFKYAPLTTKSSFNRLHNQLSIGFNSVKAAKMAGEADVVITTSPPALISIFGWRIAKKKKAKLVYDVRDIWPDVAWEMGSFSKNSLYSRIFEWNRNFILSHSDLVMAVSRGKVEKLKKYCPKADVTYITNGLDERFLDNEVKMELVDQFRLKDLFTCVYFGNLGLAQGLTQLLNIAKRAKANELPIQFLLFGSGVEENRLKKFVDENNLNNVHFPGRIKNQDMLTILKHAGMSFVSLVNERLTDSVPTKLYEALGAGCPVLLAASGESVDILNQCGLGKTVVPGDDTALWNAFTYIFEHREEYDSVKEQSRDVILNHYSRQKAAEQMVSELTTRFEK